MCLYMPAGSTITEKAVTASARTYKEGRETNCQVVHGYAAIGASVKYI